MTSRYFIAKEANQSAATIKTYIQENVPLFVKLGCCGLQVDHKSMISKTSDFQDSAYCIALTLTLGKKTRLYPCKFEAVDSTGSEESIPILEDTLEVSLWRQSNEICKMDTQKNSWSLEKKSSDFII